MDTTTGLVVGARLILSPNQDARPDGVEPDLIVVHCISLPPGQFGGPHIEELFTNCLDPEAHSYFGEICGLEVSAHVLIRRDGEIVQFVPFHQRAWHAGTSCHKGREACNDFSIGIELEGTDDGEFESRQYDSLAMLVDELVQQYPGLHRDRIVGHSDIAPGRKTDPGPGFNWGLLNALLSGEQRYNPVTKSRDGRTRTT
ncbi:MAG: 1,6-anhydro-N-acetylmuramyl-L-alanine amidase AmpD [Gammaproteobacteria bacterium]